MSGYLRKWRNEPDTPAGRILKEISSAGDGYHSTDSWDDDSLEEGGDGSCMDDIKARVEKEIGDLQAQLAVAKAEGMRKAAGIADYWASPIAALEIRKACAALPKPGEKSSTPCWDINGEWIDGPEEEDAP